MADTVVNAGTQQLVLTTNLRSLGATIVLGATISAAAGSLSLTENASTVTVPYYIYDPTIKQPWPPTISMSVINCTEFGATVLSGEIVKPRVKRIDIVSHRSKVSHFGFNVKLVNGVDVSYGR